MDIRFWGLRGGAPISGLSTARYGGNTACIEVRCGKSLLILDAGSGIINLGQALMQELQGKALDARLFLTHTHWDHIMGIPFFMPVYKLPGKLTVYGVAGMEDVLLSLFQGTEAGEFFPVPMGKPTAEISFEELREETPAGEAVVSYYYLNHPGLTIGFRVEHKGKSLVYLTDNEPYSSSNRELIRGDEDTSFLARIDREVVQFARSADLLVVDASYNDEEYGDRAGEGHSSVSDALQVALAAMVKKLVLFHHHPLRTDTQIDMLVERCRERVESLKRELEILTPAEGELIQI